MSDAKALLQAIRDDPDDDLPRLAYADWLEEYGVEEQLARAEFIRAQVALSRMPEDDPTRPALVMREAALVLHHGEGWRAAVENWVTASEGHFTVSPFCRGFLDEVHLRLD